MNRPSSGASIALVYHRVGRLRPDPFDLAVSPEHFDEQMEVVASLRPLSLRAAAAGIEHGRLPPGGIVVTFDDGYLDNLTAARPVLARRGVPATVFVATGPTGTRSVFWWDELADILRRAPADPVPARVDLGDEVLEVTLGGPPNALYDLWSRLSRRSATEIEAVLAELRARAGRAGPPEADDEQRVMTRDELAELAAGDLVEVGAHTRSHPALAARSLDEQRAEIAGSRADLQAWLDRPIRAFAYPFGRPAVDYTRTTAALARAAGYDCACSTAARELTGRTRVFEIPRQAPPDVDAGRFEAWLHERLRRPQLVRRARRAASERLAALRDR